jgi:glycosyltransferase involved in cell wall biosynthesis
MRYSVDAHAIGRHLTGNEVYVRNLMRGFAALDGTSEFIAYLSRDIGDAAADVPERFERRYVSANSFVRLGLDLARRLRQDQPDLLHVQYTAPLACPVPVIASVHDISFLEHPEYFPRLRALQLRVTVKRTIAKAVRVLTPSEFSRNAILRAYGASPERVEIVPIAVSPVFRPLHREVALARVGKRLGISSPFILTVGDLQPRKNHIGLIDAFNSLVREYPQLPHKLVIVGKDTWFAGQVHAAAKASPAAERIIFTGWATDDELLQYYSACDLMVFPSFYEGFGLPILESMACGRAVACSQTSAMPEVADSAALLFNPADATEMVRAMRDVLLDPELRVRLERLGQARASLFTWERTATRTLEIYREVAGKASRKPLETVPAARR